ncbi:hypothetical protein [Candidatus Methylomirabilis sp.]|uniref:hypothetical protein n=1 Tax=Candidatus Methylomirabilis sp. TaxID=2032687 RepID=UPI003C709D38
MGDELLKKTGAGNLFMVFGEPDVEIKYLPSPFQGEGRGEGDEINLIIEVTGEKKKDKAAKVATARSL